MVLTDEQQEILSLRARLGAAQLRINELQDDGRRIREVVRFWAPRVKNEQAGTMYQQLVAASQRLASV